MKKTSLLLAVGALLYGASGSYAIAEEEISLYPGMPEEQLMSILDQVVIPPSDVPEIAEDAPVSGDVSPAGLDPPQKLPLNVSVAATPSSTPSPLDPTDTSEAVHKPAMCDPNSFPVNGAEMKGILVEVAFADGTTSSARWQTTSPTGGEARGTGFALGKGWVLAQRDDTWYTNHPWILFTTKDIKQIVIHALDVKPPKGRVYAFDIGGKLPRAPVSGGITTLEHTEGAARGRFISLASPATVKFTAIYSDPVYVDPAHLPPPPGVLPNDGNTAIPGGGTPKHDLYGTLEINFAPAIKGTVLLTDPSFRFVADTDCLPVKEAKFDSYQGGMVNFTLTGDGSAYIAERCGASSNLVAGPFAVAYIDGAVGFSTSLTPHESCCYSVVNIANNGTQNTVPLLGVSTNANNEVCP
ncbi:hypothetical protein THII_2956 [Thioploca ingrica]|uniref:Secreted protein n=1 Tax=Thioploca ingrica TaxID=40754 RepID=A0A090AGB7_9GAMM|nr:hypothetical protein THII_2956 [Thioploca ingrica]